MGVYEPDVNGVWGWNCHQFFPGTEFYADFGVYDVTITAADQLVMGASGCLMDETDNGDGTVTRRYHVEDVIDFAWTAYPYFQVIEDKWEHVNIRLLTPPEHCSIGERYIEAVKHSLSYLTAHVGPYPYESITIMDPPLHALRTGLMEYPTFITVGTFANVPTGIRYMESLAAHEFAHQYFMGMLASNEKEEAWLDEGFVTYFEDDIMETAYGEQRSVLDIYGYCVGNREMTRLEYTGLPNPYVGTIARPGWEITEARKGLVYSKTATMLRTIRGMVGEETMDAIIMTYFDRWKFKHPRAQSFIDVVNEVVIARHGNEFGESLDWLFDQCLYDTGICDYVVANISNRRLVSPHGLFDDEAGNPVFREGEVQKDYASSVRVHRRGEMIFPIELEVHFADGTVRTEYWSGKERSKLFRYQGKSRIVAAHLDPNQKIYLDIDFNNNSLTLEPKRTPLLKYAFKAIFWVQNTLQTVSFLF